MNQHVSMKKERMKSMITVLAPTAEMLLSFTSLTATYILLKNSPFQVIYDIVMSLYNIKKRMSHACHVT